MATISALRGHEQTPLRRAAVAALTLTLAAFLAVGSWRLVNPSSSGTFLAGTGGVPGGREASRWLESHAPQGSDSTAPGAPGGLTYTQPSSTRVALSWTAASDNVGVSAYDVYRNGVLLATVPSGTLGYTDAAAVAGTAYTYRVDARDLAGNTTGSSVAVNGGTVTDTTPPSTPTGVTATATSPISIGLSWSASTDNIGVTGYSVLRGGTPVATLGGTVTSWSDTGLTPGTSYTYQVTAKDAAGNSSAPSAPATATTQSDTTAPTAPGTPTPRSPPGAATAPIARLQLGETAAGRTYDIVLDDVVVSQSAL